MNFKSVLVGLAWLALSTSCLQAQNEGQAKLDEATDAKLVAKTANDLKSVIELCEEAIELGLDEGNTAIANQLLSSTALQSAKSMVQQLPRIANNPQALRGLRRQANTLLKKAVKADPSLGEAFLLMARVETLPGGNRDRALESIGKALDLYRNDPIELSQVYSLRAALQEDNSDKLDDLGKAVEEDPTNMQAWQALIALNVALGQLDEAVQAANDLLDRDPENEFALEAATQSLIGLNKTDEAIALLTQRIEQDSDNGNLYRRRGRARSLAGEEEAALEDLNRALELNSKDAEALMLRGTLYFDLGETEKANRDISQSLLLDPTSVQGVLMRSLVASREGRYSDAINDMEKLVRIAPGNTGWVMQLASYYQMDEKPRRAIQLLDELVRRGPQEGERDLTWSILRLRADAKLSISEHASAVKDYREAIEMLEKQRSESEDGSEFDDDYSGALNNLAWVLATSPDEDLRDGDTAVEMALKACELTNYEAAHILSTLAAGYAETGDFENARKWAENAVKRGEETDNSQLEQLKEELENYKQDKPWREEQQTEESDVIPATDTIDT